MYLPNNYLPWQVTEEMEKYCEEPEIIILFRTVIMFTDLKNGKKDMF